MRPVPEGRYDWVPYACHDRGVEPRLGKDQTVPYGTDSRLETFLAVNCQATIM
jgi:hypothetical protein